MKDASGVTVANLPDFQDEIYVSLTLAAFSDEGTSVFKYVSISPSAFAFFSVIFTENSVRVLTLILRLI